MLTVFGDMGSGNCLKVKWTLDFLKRDYRWVEIDILKGESRTPEFLGISEGGQVPTVVLEDGRALAQSGAIILHLAEGSDLIPADPYDRARMLEWMFWEQNSHEPNVASARFRVVYLGWPEADIPASMIENGTKALARLEAAVGRSAFLVGDRVSLADVALVAYTRVIDGNGFRMKDWPNVAAWIGRVEAALGIV